MGKPLAEILRPQKPEEYIGQKHLMGPDSVLRKLIDAGNIPSIILWGPPGVGKTSLAQLISQTLLRPFYMLSAISSGVKDVRDVILKAESESNAILFIDEIHRFSKSQQDSLLGAVEKGVVTLIGATTENPSFEVISPLLSRCQVYILESLASHELDALIEKAVAHYKSVNLEVKVVDRDALYRLSGGDARKLYNAIELVVGFSKNESVIEITDEIVTEVIRSNLSLYDKNGEMHYDIISAFIKSMRGSDPNGAIYWMARMIAGGEDPLFIARRMLILAAEDIGLANPNALLLANACFDAVNKIGWPESRIILSECAVYLATSLKSNASYVAIESALSLVDKSGDQAVPLHLRNAPTKLMKEIGYGKQYQYAHDYDGNFSPQEYLPDALSGTCFYYPGNNKREQELKLQLKHWWKEKYGY